MDNLLVTGGSGMVGRNLLEHSASKSYNVFAPSSHELNLFDYDAVLQYLKVNSIDVIIHCAGLVGGIQANIQDPVGFLNTNLTMGVNLVNAARCVGVKKLLNLGSSCMYPRDYTNPLKEEYLLCAPLEPTNEGYALAKIAVAKLCEYTSKQFGVEYKTLIPCNLYGRGDKFGESNSHLIPAVIKKIHQAKLTANSVIELWGDGEARREFMFASDCADGIFFALNNFTKLNYYTNLGVGHDYSINDYYRIIAEVIGYDGTFVHDLTKPVGMRQKLIDISKMKNLGWGAPHNLVSGLTETYNYFLEFEGV